MTALQGTIEVRGLRCAGLLLDIEVDTDIMRAVITDDLADALDIAAIAAAARAGIAASKGRSLDERANDVRRAILALAPDSRAVRVSARARL